MSDALKKLTRGQSLSDLIRDGEGLFNAAWFNMSVDAIKDYLSRQRTLAPGPSLGNPLDTEIYLANISWQDLDQYAVSGIGRMVNMAAADDNDASVQLFREQTNIYTAPPASDEPFAITLEPIPIGQRWVCFTDNAGDRPPSGNWQAVVGLFAAWNSGTAYIVGNVATLNSNTYFCKVAHTNHTPPNGTYWQLVDDQGPYVDGSAAVVGDMVVIPYLGRATLIGVAKCRIDVSDESHRYAVPIDNDYDKLSSQSEFGPGIILDTQNNDDEEWALIILTNPLPIWSTTQDGILTTGTQTGAGDKTTENGSWNATATGEEQNESGDYVPTDFLVSVSGDLILAQANASGSPIGSTAQQFIVGIGSNPEAGNFNDSYWETSFITSGPDGIVRGASTKLAPGRFGLVAFNDAGVDANSPAFFIEKPGGTRFTGIYGPVSKPVCAGGIVWADADVDPVTPAAVILLGSSTAVDAGGGTSNFLAINAPYFDLAGLGFSTTYTDDSIVFSTLGAIATINSSPAPTTGRMRATFTTPPSATGWLKGQAFVSGVGNSLPDVPVAIIVPACTVTPTTTAIGPGAQYIFITGTGFSSFTPNVTVIFTTLGVTGQVVLLQGDPSPSIFTPYNETEIRVLITAPVGTGDLKAIVTSLGGESNAGVAATVAVVGTPTPGPFGPSVTLDTDPIPANAATLDIYGNFFDSVFANNTVALNAGTFTVTASTGTKISGTLSGIVAGPLYAVVTTNGTTSGAPVQVATVVGAPTIVENLTKLATNATSWFLTGAGFSGVYTENTVALSSGTATVLNTSTTTRLDLSISGQTAGSLTAIVTTNRQASASGQIADVVAITITPDATRMPVNQPFVNVAGANLEQTAVGSSIFVYNAVPSLIDNAAPTWVAMDGSALVWTNPSLTLTPGPIYAILAAWGGNSAPVTQIGTVGALPVLIQQKTATGAGGSAAATWDAPTVAGRGLIAVFACQATSGITIPSPWVIAKQQTFSFTSITIAYCANASAQTTSGTFSGGSGDCGLVVLEYSGIKASSPSDVQAGNNGASTSQSTGTTGSTAQSYYELAVGGFYDDQAINTFASPTNGFSIVTQFAVGSSRSMCVVSKILSTVGTAECTVTASVGGTYTYTAAIATFKGA